MNRIVQALSIGCLIAGFGCATAEVAGAPIMTPERLEELLAQEGSELAVGGNTMEFVHSGIPMWVVFDTAADRMRIVARVVSLAEMTAEDAARVLEANFDRALDARYALSGGVLYATFIHPLGPLQDSEFRSGLRQVASLVNTFGGSYSSSELHFGDGGSGREGKMEESGSESDPAI